MQTPILKESGLRAAPLKEATVLMNAGGWNKLKFSNIKILPLSSLAKIFEKSKANVASIVVVVIGQVSSLLCGLLLIKFLTAKYTPIEYGKFALALTIGGILNSFIYGPLANSATRYAAAFQERGELPLLTGAITRVAFRASVIIICFVIAVFDFNNLYYAEFFEIVPLALAYGIVSGIGIILMSIVNALNYRVSYAFFQALDIFIRGLSTVISVTVFNQSPANALYGYLFGSIIFCGLCLIYLRNKDVMLPVEDLKNTAYQSLKNTEKTVFLYSFPFVSWAFVSVFCTYGDRWILGFFSNEGEVGVYYALYQIGSTPINFIATVFSVLALPRVFAVAGDGVDLERNDLAGKILIQTTIMQASCMGIVVLLFCVIGDKVILFLTNQQFASRSNMLILIMLSTSLVQSARYLASKGMYVSKHRVYFKPLVIQAVLFIALGAPMAREFGALGFGVSAVCSSAIYFILIFCANKRLDEEMLRSTQVKCHKALF